MATSSSQAAANRASLSRALSALSKAGGSATSAQSIYSGGSTPVKSANTVLPKSGTTGNAAGSQIITPPKAGTTGNPAGASAPIGSGTNKKAAQTAVAIGSIPKKQDWQSTLAGVQQSNVESQQAGGQVSSSNVGYGISKDPNAIAPKAPAPKQTASAFDAFQAFQQNRVNKDLQTMGLDTARGSGISAPYSNLMTRSDGSNAPKELAPTSLPQVNTLVKDSTPLNGSPSTNTANTASAINALQRTATPTDSTSPTPALSPTVAGNNQAPVTSKSSFGLDNTIIKKAPALQETQIAAGIADETRAQADAAEQAVASATNEEDRAYYQNLADIARNEADTAEQEYQRLLVQSDEEKRIQAQLDSETQALRLGQTDVAGQAIPLSFITGQQSALERRSLDRTAPLASKLGQLQSARQAAMQGAKQKLSSRDNRFESAQSNLDSFTTEQRKRQQQLADKATERANTVEDRNFKTANTAPKTTTPSGTKPNTYKNSQQIPESLRNSVLDDIVINQGNLPDIISAYPEISPSVIQAIFNQFSTQGTGGGSSRSL